MNYFSFDFLLKRVLYAMLIAIGIPGSSLAGEHTWILPGQCTPPELWTRGIVGTMEPKLEEHDKIVFQMKDGQLLLDFEAAGLDSLKVGWMWISPAKILSGATVFKKSSGSFDLAGAEDAELKALKFTCFFDNRTNRLSLSLAVASPRYALIHKQGEQGAAGEQPRAR